MQFLFSEDHPENAPGKEKGKNKKGKFLITPGTIFLNAMRGKKIAEIAFIDFECQIFPRCGKKNFPSVPMLLYRILKR